MELMNWNILSVAKSEIGSNRKHRGNRYLTVIQYSIDMFQSLIEMRRVIRNNGRIIMVVGRESKIRSVSFENYKIIASLAMGGAGLDLVLRQERKFVTRFGEPIYEDLLHFTPAKKDVNISTNFSREIGVHFLKKAMTYAPFSVQKDIISAINRSKEVLASPLFLEQNSKKEKRFGNENITS